MCCVEHHTHPEVTVRGDQLKFKCCCEKFKATLIERSKTLIANAAKNDIERQLKNLFK